MIDSQSVWIPDKEKLTKKEGNGHSNAVALFWAIKKPAEAGLN
jgi:hypothetical protein